MNQYSIKVINNSGDQQTYALFSEVPVVTGKVQGKIWQNVFAIARTPPGDNGNFEIFKQFYALCGSSDGAPADGVVVSVSGTKDVTLGSSKADGTAVKGSSWQMDVIDQAPQFNKSLPAGGLVNAFEIVTTSNFTLAEATKFNYVIGLGGTKTGNKKSPAATFVPQPNVHYQIQPVNTFYLTFGKYTQGTLIDTRMLGSVAKIDFTSLPTDVVIVHDDHGNLNIQA